MKKTVAILFMFLFLTAHTVLGQVLRLPILIHHYIEHVELENKSLIDFLSEHYADKINHPDDKHHDHEKLPFKTIDNHHSAPIIDYKPSYSIPSLKCFPQTRKVDGPIQGPQNSSNAYLNSIWQPPKFS